MSWELVGGDPAPGSPDALGSASNAFSAVSDLAGDAVSGLVRDTRAVDFDAWRGAAATAFRSATADVPDQVRLAETSYREAGQALARYQVTLEQAQGEARGVLVQAEQAAADRSAAESRRAAAQTQVDSLARQYKQAEVALAGVRRQLTLATDPGQHTILVTRFTNLQATERRIYADYNDAVATVNRHVGSRNEAQTRLDQAGRRADGIRNHVEQAAQQAMAELRTAERDAHLPDFWQRQGTVARENLEEYGPVVIHSLELGQTLFGIAAVVFPPGAAVFTACSLICGGLALAGKIAVDEFDGNGISRDQWLHFGLDALGTVAASTTFGKSVKMVAATKWLATAHAVGEFGLDARDGGLEYALKRSAGSIVAGVAVGGLAAGGGALLRKSIKSADKNPAIHSALVSISKDVGHSDFRVPLVLEKDSRFTQTLLAPGLQSHGGQFLVGGSPGGHELEDHALSGHMLNEQLRERIEHGLDPLEDKLEGAIDQQLGAEDRPAPAGGGW